MTRTNNNQSNGKKLVAAIKSATPQKQRANLKAQLNRVLWKGGYTNENTINPELKSILYAGTMRPLYWFKSLIGQLIYVTSEVGFTGLLQVVNDKHAAKLEKAQAYGYHFGSITNLGERLNDYNIEKKIEAANKEQLQPVIVDWNTAKDELTERVNVFYQAKRAPHRPKEMNYHQSEMFFKILRENAEKIEELREYDLDQMTEGDRIKTYDEVMRLTDIEAISTAVRTIATSAQCAIHRYLEMHGHKTWHQNILGHLATLLFDSKDLDNRNEQFNSQLKELRDFVLRPDIISRFADGEIGCYKYRNLIKTFDTLTAFFEAFSGEIEEAELSFLFIECYKSEYKYENFKDTNSYYNRLATIQHATNEATKEYDTSVKSRKYKIM